MVLIHTIIVQQKTFINSNKENNLSTNYCSYKNDFYKATIYNE